MASTVRLPFLCEARTKRAPDVVVSGAESTQEKSRRADPRCRAMAQSGAGQKSWTGSPSWHAVPIPSTGVSARRSEDTHRRYIEPQVGGLTGEQSPICRNGNTGPGPKFDFQLRWFERLPSTLRHFSHRRDGAPVVLAGDYKR